MELVITKTVITPHIENFIENMRELNLIYYASDAAKKMEFDSDEDFFQLIEQAMEICSNANIPIEGNFKKIYKCSLDGISSDWKLSVLGYTLVCMNGGSLNPDIAMIQLQSLKDQALNEL